MRDFYILKTFLSFLFSFLFTSSLLATIIEESPFPRRVATIGIDSKHELSLAYKSSILQDVLTCNDVLFSIFQHLPPKSLSRIASVSKKWRTVSHDRRLWEPFYRKMGLRFPPYLHPKIGVISALNSLIINRIINELKTPQDNDRFVALGYKEAIEKKFKGLMEGNHGYPKNLKAARQFNEQLAAQRYPLACERKVFGLYFEIDSYREDPNAARHFNDQLISEGYPKAIERRIKGLLSGYFGYSQSQESAVAYVDQLVKQGFDIAIERKIKGLLEGKYGYIENLPEAWELNERLVARGNLEAIERKVEWVFTREQNPLTVLSRTVFTSIRDFFCYPWCSKEAPNEDLGEEIKCIRILNDRLVSVGSCKAITRKYDGLVNGNCFYQKDSEAAERLRQYLISQENHKARERKKKEFLLSSYYIQNEEALNKYINFLREYASPDNF